MGEENQCPCYGRTDAWKCKLKLTTPLGTPAPPIYIPEGTQPGFIDSCNTCARGYCGRPLKDGCRSGEQVPAKLIFVMEWYDRESDQVKKYTLSYYDVDKTCEISDLIHHRRFLKRHVVDTVTLPELVVGNVINIYGRKMTVMEYADSCTHQFLDKFQQRAFCLIRPHAVQCLGQIYEVLEKNFKILRCRMAMFTQELARRFYQDHSEDGHSFGELISSVTSSPIVAFLLVGDNAIERLMRIAGDKDPATAKLTNADTLRAVFGINAMDCAVDVSETPESVSRDSSLFFTECRLLLPTLAPAAVLGKCSTLAIIKPHAVRKGVVGKIMYDITRAGFQITGMEMFYLDRTHAEEIYEIYRGILNEYSEMTQELSLGPCIVMEISGCGEKTAKAFRELTGPMDPVLARKLRPNSLRAKYGGWSRIKNAVHCTDLECDAETEVEYFFKVLQMLE